MPFTRDMAKDNNIRLFVISEKCVMSPRFHSKFSCDGKQQKYHVSYTLSSITPGTVGNTRIFSDTDNRDWYLKSEIKLIAVNWETRRSTKFPKHLYEKMNKFVDKENTPIMTKRQDAIVHPKKAFKTTTKTRYSDLDFNLHVNVPEYYKFCSDAASKASLSGYYRHFISDIVKYPVMLTEATFLGECGPDEHLVVYTWQDDYDFTKLYFAIFLRDVKLFQACFKHDSKMLQDKVISSL
ncbi:uncharacterized protein LOC117341631 [Pecten maximus]|uniref:uncharacterized protein LOC117341631 n=1 Tax=Pecten maximus TaxID=6579 RepID=UPI001458F67B|nr:uncharacterized protein LOC117341631 [Pecten maximus]